MADEQRSQALIQIDADASEDVADAYDTGGAGALIAEVDVVAAASSGSFLYFQHAASPNERAFVDMVPVVDLSVAGPVCVRLVGVMRWVRWRAEIAGGSCWFLIDSLTPES